MHKRAEGKMECDRVLYKYPDEGPYWCWKDISKVPISYSNLILYLTDQTNFDLQKGPRLDKEK